MKTNPEDLSAVLVTDCGSTTTKAVLFQKTEDGWRQTHRGEAPTTVEAPIEDVTVGALNAFREVEEISGRIILRANDDDSKSPFRLSDSHSGNGIDLYLSTSSAGGGLQMIVAGVVKTMTTESAQRAALGAGAIVLDAISADDGREDHERIDRIRHLKPDIVLLSGGIDGGSKNHVIENAEVIRAAAPRPRFGDTLKLPVIYAGNKDAKQEVSEILAPIAQFQAVPNIRPDLELEQLEPARDAIHEFFLEHVMSHAPGYDKLLDWTPVSVMPTPGAVGDMVKSLAESQELQVLAVDIGGATTDVFSVFNSHDSSQQVFNRTVSANLGMSYSVANVLIEAGEENISRWLPFVMSGAEVNDRLRNKMIRPTSIPQTLEDLHLEQAVCREALRLSLDHHRLLAVGLSGVKKSRGIADIFSQTSNRQELVKLKELDLVIGSGGVLSHAPDRKSAMLMMLDAFALEGLTQITVDSIFMMPHLGVFSSVHPEAAQEILFRDCLINLGHAVAPIYPDKLDLSELAQVSMHGADLGAVKKGKINLIETEAYQKGMIRIKPLHNSIDVGAGRGKVLEQEIETGTVGIIFDGRNRPIVMPSEASARADFQRDIFKALDIRIN